MAAEQQGWTRLPGTVAQTMSKSGRVCIATPGYKTGTGQVQVETVQ